MQVTDHFPTGSGAAVAALPADAKFSLSLEERERLRDRVLARLRGKGIKPAMPLWIKQVSENRFLKRVAKYLPWAMLTGSLALKFTIGAPAMLIGASIFGGVSLVMRHLYKRSATVKRMVDKVGKRQCFRLMAGVIFGGSLWMSQTNPVLAQFFQGAEDFFGATFPDAADVIPIVFGVIRALFLIYVAVALIRVVQAARNDDDWQQMARQPVIIVMAVVLGDVLTTLIVGA